MPCVCAALCVCKTQQPWGGGNAQNGECSHSHSHRFREEEKEKNPHRCEYKSAHPKGIFASAWLDAHLFRQSGTSSRILANNVSSASSSFCRGSFHFLFLDSVSIHERRMLPRLLADVFPFVYKPRRARERLCQEMWSKHTSGNVFRCDRESN